MARVAGEIHSLVRAICLRGLGGDLHGGDNWAEEEEEATAEITPAAPAPKGARWSRSFIGYLIFKDLFFPVCSM